MNQPLQPHRPNQLSCEHFDRWRQQQGLRIIRLEAERIHRDRSVWRCFDSAADEVLYLKVRERPRPRPSPDRVPEDVLSFYAERLFECADCGVSLEREVPGLGLDRADAKERGGACSTAGKGLATFHNLSRFENEPIAPKKILDKLIGWVEWIRTRGAPLERIPSLSELRKSLVERLSHPLTHSWIHGDLKPEHVFIREGRMRFVDRDALKKGFTLLDPANLVNHMDWLWQDSDGPVRFFLSVYKRETEEFDPWMFQFARFHCAIRTIRNRVAANCGGKGEAIEAPLRTLSSIWAKISQ